MLIELINKFKYGSRELKVDEELIRKEKALIEDLSEGDLYLKHYDLYDELRRVEAKYKHLKSSLKQYIEYLKKSEEEQEEIRTEKKSLFSFHWSSLREILKESEKPSFIIDTLIKEAMNAKGGFFF